MARKNSTRKARFKVALALAGMAQKDWADLEGITPGHLSMTLSGRKSKSLSEKIDAFIAAEEKKAAKRYGAFLRDFRKSA